jgi:hypothetical protein
MARGSSLIWRTAPNLANDSLTWHVASQYGSLICSPVLSYGVWLPKPVCCYLICCMQDTQSSLT